jgi:hypothetical protein
MKISCATAQLGEEGYLLKDGAVEQMRVYTSGGNGSIKVRSYPSPDSAALTRSLLLVCERAGREHDRSTCRLPPYELLCRVARTGGGGDIRENYGFMLDGKNHKADASAVDTKVDQSLSLSDLRTS